MGKMPTNSLGKSSELKLHCFCLLDAYSKPKDMCSVLLCTETTLSNPPVVQPKSSCDVHLLRSPWLSGPFRNKIVLCM